jgi:hypothetical protein
MSFARSVAVLFTLSFTLCKPLFTTPTTSQSRGIRPDNREGHNGGLPENRGLSPRIPLNILGLLDAEALELGEAHPAFANLLVNCQEKRTAHGWISESARMSEASTRRQRRRHVAAGITHVSSLGFRGSATWQSGYFLCMVASRGVVFISC